MRIAVVSDTHLPSGRRQLPARLLEECAAADLILHAGDFSVLSVLVELELLGPVEAVLGNNDDDDLAARLPVERVVETGGVRVGMVHDSGPREGRGQRLREQFPACHAVVFGHSHKPVIEQHGDLLLLNPGSALLRRRAPVCTMAVLEVAGGRMTADLIDLP
jgi:putative phosphoesterase